MGGVLLLLLLLLLKYYPEVKMLNVCFTNKNEKLFQTDLNSDLKEEPGLKSRSCFIFFEPIMRGS